MQTVTANRSTEAIDVLLDEIEYLTKDRNRCRRGQVFATWTAAVLLGVAVWGWVSAIR